jgi:2-deoxy-D-gluconate 3-dehydrogenase
MAERRPVLERMSLRGKTAIVTGAGRGIGRGIARAFAEAGADLALASRTAAEIESAAKEARSLVVRAVAIPTDMGEADEVITMVDGALDELGKVDILVNNAGMTIRGTALGYKMEDFDKVTDVNLRSVMIASQHAARSMVERKIEGRILNTCSLASHIGLPNTIAYTAAKGAVATMTKVMAVEWAEYGITVNGISPGYIDTPMTAPLQDDEAKNAWILSRVPLKRWGTPEDMAGLYVFLASDAASYITGQIFPVDGGWLGA